MLMKRGAMNLFLVGTSLLFTTLGGASAINAHLTAKASRHHGRRAMAAAAVDEEDAGTAYHERRRLAKSNLVEASKMIFDGSGGIIGLPHHDARRRRALIDESHKMREESIGKEEGNIRGTRMTRKLPGGGGGNDVTCVDGTPITADVDGDLIVSDGVTCIVNNGVTIHGDIVMKNGASTLGVGTSQWVEDPPGSYHWVDLHAHETVIVNGDVIVEDVVNPPTNAYQSHVGINYKAIVEGKITIKDSAFDYIYLGGTVGGDVTVEKVTTFNYLGVEVSTDEDITLKEVVNENPNWTGENWHEAASRGNQVWTHVYATDPNKTPTIKIEKDCHFDWLDVTVGSAKKVTITETDPNSIHIDVYIYGTVEEGVYATDVDLAGDLWYYVNEDTHIKGDLVTENVIAWSVGIYYINKIYGLRPPTKGLIDGSVYLDKVVVVGFLDGWGGYFSSTDGQFYNGVQVNGNLVYKECEATEGYLSIWQMLVIGDIVVKDSLGKWHPDFINNEIDPTDPANSNIPWGAIEVVDSYAKNIKLERNTGDDMDVSGNTLLDDNGEFFGDGHIKIKENEMDNFILVGMQYTATHWKTGEILGLDISPNILPNGILIVENNVVSNIDFGITGANNVVGDYQASGNTPTANIHIEASPPVAVP